jgi:hypothetical protein
LVKLRSSRDWILGGLIVCEGQGQGARYDRCIALPEIPLTLRRLYAGFITIIIIIIIIVLKRAYERRDEEETHGTRKKALSLVLQFFVDLSRAFSLYSHHLWKVPSNTCPLLVLHSLADANPLHEDLYTILSPHSVEFLVRSSENTLVGVTARTPSKSAAK